MRAELTGVDDSPPGVVPMYTLNPVTSVDAAFATGPEERSDGAVADGPSKAAWSAPARGPPTASRRAASGAGTLTVSATAADDDTATPAVPLYVATIGCEPTSE